MNLTATDLVVHVGHVSLQTAPRWTASHAPKNHGERQPVTAASIQHLQGCNDGCCATEVAHELIEVILKGAGIVGHNIDRSPSLQTTMVVCVGQRHDEPFSVWVPFTTEQCAGSGFNAGVGGSSRAVWDTKLLDVKHQQSMLMTAVLTSCTTVGSACVIP